MRSTRGGIVAENSTVWRCSGVAVRIASMSSAKPMSSISSASSSTTSRTASSAQRAAVDVVDGPPGRGHDDVHAVAQRAELAPDRLAAVHRDDLGAAGPGRSARSPPTPARRARGSGTSTRAIGSPRRAVDHLQRGQREGRRLAGAGGGLAEHVVAGEHLGHGVALDRRRLLVAEGGHRGEQLGSQPELVERGHQASAWKRPGSTSTASPRASIRCTWSSAVRRSTVSAKECSTCGR